MSIINLQEISPNSWKALYQGNYGIYTIKIKTDGNKTVDFSCSCPSDYYPCKHIPMIEEAIEQRIAESRKDNDKHEIKIEQLLKDLPKEELYNFIIRQAKYNPQLKNAVLLQFAHKAKKKAKTSNNYTQLLREALDGLNFDVYDIYDNEYSIDIDGLSLWLDKAQEHAAQNNPNEAILICKACIEEYASWCEKQEDYIVENINISYQEKPFDILEQIISMPEVDCKGLFDYCKSEMQKPKYANMEMHDSFNKLFMKLSIMVGSDDFIALQDKLLQEIDDKSSYEAENILEHKINFYRDNEQPDKAWEVIKEHLQIESFRKEFVEKLIAENKFQEAKELITEFISQNKKETWHIRSWYELKLQIAQKEKDIPEIERISFILIESRFDYKFYEIYKSAFTKEEWPEKAEALIRHYGKLDNGKQLNSSIADVLQAEKQSERLMQYVERHLSIDDLVKYYLEFSSLFPEKTLALFRQAIDKYAKDNLGRDHYERIANLFGRMVKIEGGKELVKKMIIQYQALYKSRRAMMEIMSGFLKKL